jgi:soluble lytic murein transglycosylase-like protein
MKFQTEINGAAARHGLDPLLVCGVVSIESGFDQYAWNPEPAYRYFWNVRTGTPFRATTPAEVAAKFPPKDFPTIFGDPDQEWWGQSASWGLMQLMGAVAREHGFRGPYLTELCDPIMVLEYGCLHLAGLMAWAKGNSTQALAAYNGGKGGNEAKPFRNQSYATKVLDETAMLRSQV